MKLSVCLIVKNEEERLEAAVESARATGLAHEIVVTDTGSTDGTVALAKRLGARVSHFEWCEDFAAARNACLKEALGDWVLWLDADERIKAGSGPALKRDLQDQQIVAYHMVREDFFSRERPDKFSEMYQMRLVRRSLPTKFIGRIHEHLDPAPFELAARMRKGVGVSGARLQHWGYTNDRLPDKLRRAAKLCEMELADRPGQMYYQVELARSLLMLDEPGSRERGMAVLGDAALALVAQKHSAQAPSPMAASLIEQLLAVPNQAWVSIDDLLELSCRWFPKSVPLVWSAARTWSIRGDWDKAEAALRRVMELVDRGTHDRYMSFDPRVGEDARFNLGVVLIRQARLDEAEAIFTTLADSPRRGPDARQNLAAIAEVRRQG